MPFTRRHLLQTSALAALARRTSFAANDNIQIAIIGLGGQGTADVRSSLLNPGVKLVAVADVYDGRRAHAREVWGNDVFSTRDYREVLARKEIDAVIIATPDHWHSQISIDAMNAGKDVYCEKPMVQHLDDGKPVMEAQKRTGRIMQVGSQRVSSVLYAKARDLLKQGAIGELNTIEAWWDRNSAVGAWQYSIPTDASPATVDWDGFLGRAPKVPFDAKRIFRWRNYRDYGTGVAGDLFVHLFSGMHFITGERGPSRVYATGGLRFWKDGRDVQDVLLGLYDYPTFNLSLRVNFVNGAAENSGLRFVGSEGIINIGNSITLSKHPREARPGYTIDTFTFEEQKRSLAEYRAKYPLQATNADSIRPDVDERFTPPPGYSDHVDHHRVFIDAVRSRKPVIEDPVFGFRAAGPALLSLISAFEKRECMWNPETMTAS